MSISDNYIPVKQQGDATTEEFTGNWRVFNEDYLRVYLEDVSTGALVLQVQGTDYDLTFDDSGFIVDFGAYTIPTSSSYVVINREVPLNQTDPYRTSKGFQGEVIENAFDKLTAISQDQQDQVDRSPKFSVGSSITDPSLPIPQDGFGIVWDGVTGALRNTESTLAVLEGNASIVAGGIANINIVAGSISSVNSVASNEANINTVGGSISSVNTVAGISSNVSTVASNDANITTCADDIAAIIAAPSAASDAQAALAATLAAFDNFDDRYLGAKSSDPSVDNDGEPLVAGAIYFNTTDGIMKVYTGSVWVAAYVSGTDFLAKPNNLSDVSSASASRGNLGLGGLAVENTISNQDWLGQDLSCGNGGTGRSSHTPYGVICGGTTSQGAHQSVSDIGTAGQVLTSNGAGALPTMQDADSAVKQAPVSATKTGTSTTSSSTFADISDLSVSITPTSSSSRVLVMWSVNVAGLPGVKAFLKLLRGTTGICLGGASGDRTPTTNFARISHLDEQWCLSGSYIDSPATTSATTYKLQFASYDGSMYVNRSETNFNNSNVGLTASTITVMEIE